VEEIQVLEVGPDRVAAALARAGVYDPRGANTPASIAAGGACFEFRTPGGCCAFVVRVDDGVWWIDGAASDGGEGMAFIGLELAEHAAREAGCWAVAFETARPGLVRVAMRQGYRVVEHVRGSKPGGDAVPAWIMKKAV
jgi:hypothetical protein